MVNEIRVISILALIPFLFSCAGSKDLAPDGSEIPIGVNTIIAHTDKDQETAYSEIGSFLIAQGFSIENTSPEFYSISTDYQETSRGSGLLEAPLTIAISASITGGDNGSSIILSARLKNNMFDGDRVKQKGFSGSVMRLAWDEFYSVAKTFSENLTFETR